MSLPFGDLEFSGSLSVLPVASTDSSGGEALEGALWEAGFLAATPPASIVDCFCPLGFLTLALDFLAGLVLVGVTTSPSTLIVRCGVSPSVAFPFGASGTIWLGGVSS